MTLRGHVANGVIVVDEPAALVEGAQVVISFPVAVLGETSGDLPQESVSETLRARLASKFPGLMALAGSVEGFSPHDAENYERDLYERP